MLAQLKLTLSQRKTASLLELTKQLGAEPNAVRGMLSHWIRKGKVKQCQPNSACGSTCGKCNPLLTEHYEWL